MGTMRLVVDGAGRSFPTEVTADGMNYTHLFPPSEWKYGFAVVVAFLACMVGWGFFHSRLLRWL